MSKEQNKALFYTQGEEEVLKNLDTSVDGLSTAQAKERLDAYGYNELDEGEKRSLLSKFIDQFKDLMIIILLVAAALSVITEGMHGLTDACIILAVVVLNAAFGVYQEGQAEAAIEALKNMSSPMARVRRDGHVVEIDSRELVPGDIVLLEAGDVVPADMRLLEAASLKIEEAALTGESVPVEKDVTETVDAEAGIGDRVNMGYQNSNVTYGRGTGVVTNTGMYTEVGKIADMLANADESQTPLKQSLEQLSKTLTYLIVAIALVTFLVSVFIRGEQPLEGLMVAVALAVAAIPEGLPAIVTILLSLGTTSLAKRNSIVRKLPAVETLGSTEIIASDKTGTLTMNQMTVEKVYTNGQLQSAATELGADNTTLRIMNFANDTKVDPDGKLIGDPTETALVQFGLDHNFDVRDVLKSEPRVAELPFDSDRKLMSTIHKEADGSYFIAVKGAPDQLLKRVTRIEVNGEVRPITDEDKKLILTSAIQAPSAGCQLLYTILDITDQTKKDRLADLCDHQAFIAAGQMVLIFCADCQKWDAFYKEAGISPRCPGAGDLLLAVEDAMIAAQNAVVAAESLGIGSCYIGDIMENVEEIRTLLALPEYVYPACMLVFGHPTAQQQNRTKPSRFDLSDIVCENAYQAKESSDIRRMFAGRTGLQGYDAWMQAFCNRKYESAFSREMNRSMEIYLKPFLEKEGVSDLEK